MCEDATLRVPVAAAEDLAGFDVSASSNSTPTSSTLALTIFRNSSTRHNSLSLSLPLSINTTQQSTAKRHTKRQYSEYEPLLQNFVEVSYSLERRTVASTSINRCASLLVRAVRELTKFCKIGSYSLKRRTVASTSESSIAFYFEYTLVGCAGGGGRAGGGGGGERALFGSAAYRGEVIPVALLPLIEHCTPQLCDKLVNAICMPFSLPLMCLSEA